MSLHGDEPLFIAIVLLSFVDFDTRDLLFESTSDKCYSCRLIRQVIYIVGRALDCGVVRNNLLKR